MENYPLVTIGLPFYNDSKFLSMAINSVINQSYPNWELLLVDDGSSDDSLEIARQYENAKIKVFSDGRNLGLASRLNETIRKAKGVYYARMDADDIMAVNRIESQVKYLVEHPEVDVLGTSAHVINSSNEIIGGIKYPHISDNYNLIDILNGAVFVHPSIMGKTDWFSRNHYDERLKRNQDRGLWLKTVDESKFVYLSERWMFYRMMGDSSIRKEIRSLKSNRILYFDILYSEMNKKWLGIKYYTISLIKLIIRISFILLNMKKLLAKSRYDQYSPEDIIKYENELKKAIKYET